MNIALKLALGVSPHELITEELRTKEIVLEKSKSSIMQENESKNK